MVNVRAYKKKVGNVNEIFGKIEEGSFSFLFYPLPIKYMMDFHMKTKRKMILSSYHVDDQDPLFVVSSVTFSHLKS